jgi:hypothetical protein
LSYPKKHEEFERGGFEIGREDKLRALKKCMTKKKILAEESDTSSIAEFSKLISEK